MNFSKRLIKCVYFEAGGVMSATPQKVYVVLL